MIALKNVVAEAERFERARREALDDDVGRPGQCGERGPSFSRLQIEDDRPLVAVEVEEEAALFGVRDVALERPEPPGDVAARLLDLDDVGAEIREQCVAYGPAMCCVRSRTRRRRVPARAPPWLDGSALGMWPEL